MRRGHRMGLVVVAVGLLWAVAWTQEGPPERARVAEVVQFVQQLLQTGAPMVTLQQTLQARDGTTPSAEHMVDVVNKLVAEVYRAGVYNLALELATQAHTYGENQLGAEHPQTLTSLNNLAGLYESQGRSGEAEPLYQRALAVREPVLGAEHPDTLMSLNNLAGLYELQGRYGEAEPLYQRALATAEQVLGAEHPQTLTMQLNYTILLVAQQQPGRALQQLKLLEPRLLGFAGVQLHTTLQEQVRRRFLVRQSPMQDAVFTLAVQHQASAEARSFAADVLLRWKQVQRDEDAYLERLIRTSGDPVVKRLGQEIRALRRDLSHLARAPQPDPEALREKHRALDAKEVELTRHSRRYRQHLAVRGVRLDDVRTHLPQGSALLELRVYNPIDFTTGKRGDLHWMALLLPAVTGGEPALVLQDLGPVAESVKRWKALRQHDDRETAAHLYQSLFGALDRQLQRFPTLYIAPDSFMHLVALTRLVLPDGRYWAERQTLRQLQTGRDLIPEEAEAVPKGLLALGGIDYEDFTGQSTAMADPQQQDTHRQLVHTIGRLNPLRHSGAEAEGITQLYWDAYGGNAEWWQGRAASEARLKALATPPRVLHLATHGFYLPTTGGSAARPLTLSGLALAGANQGMQGHLNSDGEDGILYALEVQNLNLEGTELVALSACDTGQGELDYSDGVYGLARAFRVAGARRVLMTLWPVDDGHAREFMLRFYANWLTPEKGRNPTRDPVIALQQTRLAFLTHPDPALREPRVWAPYVLVETRAGR